MKKDLNKTLSEPKGMRNIARSGLGFIAGFFALFGAYSFKENNLIVGTIAFILGIILFIYAYKAR